MEERSPAGAADVEVAVLLEHRATLEGWLAKLDDIGDEVSPRVAERVRRDYLERLREVSEQLATREDAVRAELQARLDELDRAEQAHDDARETLEEHLLRQRIGEIAPGDWEARRPSLEAAVADALERLESLRAETARLEAVLAEIAGDAPAPAAEEEVVVEVAEEEDAPDPAVAAPPEEPVEEETEPVGRTDDLGFLDELDRAIALPTRTGGAAAAVPPPAPAPPPRRGAKCPECGYTNDLGAWYCGVCGVDLA